MNKTLAGPIACFLTVLILATLGLNAPARAQTFDDKRAVNTAGKQRMLSQKMSKEVLLVALDIDRTGNLSNLKHSHALFNRTLSALREGDTVLGLRVSESQDVRSSLDSVQGIWHEMELAVRGILESGQASPERVKIIARTNLPLLQAMNETVRAYQAEAATDNLHETLAVTINVSGQQRMLSQKMSKEYLLIAYGHEAEKNRQKLGRTIALFERTLLGLINGDSELRLLPTPTDEIDQQLAKIRRLWEDFAPLVMNVADGGIATEAAIQIVVRENLALLKETDAAVLMYERFARDQTS